ncbi:MAG: hypothetical protein ACPHEP_05780 [Acidimicrobiales bacterium]
MARSDTRNMQKSSVNSLAFTGDNFSVTQKKLNSLDRGMRTDNTLVAYLKEIDKSLSNKDEEKYNKLKNRFIERFGDSIAFPNFSNSVRRSNQSGDSRTARSKLQTKAVEVEQRPEPPQTQKPKPELVERKGPSYSDDMTPPKRFSEASGRKFIRDILGDDTKVEYEDMSEAGPDGARKGGMRKKAAPKSKYGMKAGGFTRRGGMYKKGMS